jgi:hypothetical protein
MQQTLLPIKSKLAATRGRLRFVDLALGVARAILAVSVVLLVLFTLDTVLQPPLPVVRAFALFMVLVAFSGAGAFLGKPLRRKLSDDHVALLVEESYPELEGGLVSSVQLARELDRADLYTSRALIQSTIDRTSVQVREMDFDRVVNSGPLVPLWTLIAAFLLMGGMLLSNETVGEYAGIFYQRVVKGEDVPYPTLVRLRVVIAGMNPSEGTHQVAKGDDLEVQVFVDKGARLVDRLLIHTRYGTGKKTETRDLLKYDERYVKSFQNVTEPFTFYVEDPNNDVHSKSFEITVVQRPWVEQYEFVLTYPKYTGKSDETVRQPDLQVPAGTLITYAVVSNKPLDSAKLWIDRDKRSSGAKTPKKRGVRAKIEVESVQGPTPQLLSELSASDFGGGGPWSTLGPTVTELGLTSSERQDRALVGSFRVDGDLRFRFQLRSQEDLETGNKPVVFTVKAVPDRRPVVTIPTPGRTKLITPLAKVPLVIEARDDYGIADVVLRFSVQKDGEDERGAQQTIQLEGVTVGARSLRLTHSLDATDQRLQPGDRLFYQATAFDHNLDESKRFKESRQYEIRVVRPDDLERMLQDRLTGIKERLRAAAKDQLAARKGADTFVKSLGPKETLVENDKRTLQRLDYDQRRVTTRLVDVKKELEDILNERQLNRLTEEASLDLLKALSGGVRDLAERASPLVSRELEDSRAASLLDARTRARLVRVPDLQSEIHSAIEALIARIDKWGDFTEVLQEIRDVLQGEEKIIEETRKTVRSENR